MPGSHALGAYRSYIEALRQLHEFIRSGQGDSEHADALRDNMDTYWEELSPDEIRRVRQMSSDLHMLSTSVGQHNDAGADATRREVTRAYQSEDWERILLLLHESPGLYPIYQAHWMRYVCYKNLGETEVALDFALAAADLHPSDHRLVQSAAGYIMTLGRFEEAVKVLETYANYSQYDWEIAILHG